MPTNDERREIAENLRTMCSCGCNYKEEFYYLLEETVMDEWDYHEFREVADRLADLIEPEQEIIDGKEIVRCKDCENYVPAKDEDHEDGCALAYAYLFETSPEGFCAWGERKENAVVDIEG